MAERSIVGSIVEFVDEVGRYADLGFDEFIVPDWTLGDDTSTVTACSANSSPRSPPPTADRHRRRHVCAESADRVTVARDCTAQASGTRDARDGNFE